MFSYHAQQRMQQRGISKDALELLLAYGRSSYHRGAEIVAFDHSALLKMMRIEVISPQILARLRRLYAVLADGMILTVSHRTHGFRRDRKVYRTR